MAAEGRGPALYRKENTWERGRRILREQGVERWPGVGGRPLPAGVAEELRGTKILRDALGIPDCGPG